ncbi:hypothetical protein EOL96_02040 [Candidatus Saccharibacteria bacterium]|nr:hypothetical protein [Candidatus Saccharibacteria bacterium]
MNKNMPLYRKYYVDKQSENLELFRLLKERFGLESAIYPGCFVHITPSLIFSKTAYIDSDKRVETFFKDSEVLDWVDTNKEYSDKAQIIAFQQDYSKKTPSEIGHYDLLISQYAGFVSQDCKHYLKSGGLLLANNSHADAGLAFLDTDYELIAVMNRNNGKWSFNEDDLAEYFIPKKGNHPPKSELLSTMRGIGYKKTAPNYIFKKI